MFKNAKQKLDCYYFNRYSILMGVQFGIGIVSMWRPILCMRMEYEK